MSSTDMILLTVWFVGSAIGFLWARHRGRLDTDWTTERSRNAWDKHWKDGGR